MKVEITKSVLEDIADRVTYYVKRLDRCLHYSDVLDSLYLTFHVIGIEILFSRYDHWVKVSCGDLRVSVKW